MLAGKGHKGIGISRLKKKKTYSTEAKLVQLMMLPLIYLEDQLKENHEMPVYQ